MNSYTFNSRSQVVNAEMRPASKPLSVLLPNRRMETVSFFAGAHTFGLVWRRRGTLNRADDKQGSDIRTSARPNYFFRR